MQGNTEGPIPEAVTPDQLKDLRDKFLLEVKKGAEGELPGYCRPNCRGKWIDPMLLKRVDILI